MAIEGLPLGLSLSPRAAPQPGFKFFDAALAGRYVRLGSGWAKISDIAKAVVSGSGIGRKLTIVQKAGAKSLNRINDPLASGKHDAALQDIEAIRAALKKEGVPEEQG